MFMNSCVKLQLVKIYYGYGQVLHGFIVLDTINKDACVDSSIYIANSSNQILSEYFMAQ